MLQTPLNLSSSEVIATYVYKNGLLDANYSFATAVGLFNSAINFALILRSLLVLGNSQASMQAPNPTQYQLFETMKMLLKYSLIVVASVPVLLLYLLAQKCFVKGVILGSLKE